MVERCVPVAECDLTMGNSQYQGHHQDTLGSEWLYRLWDFDVRLATQQDLKILALYLRSAATAGNGAGQACSISAIVLPAGSLKEQELETDPKYK